jgi:Anti-sigma-K factor rskA, C-terminal
MKTQKLIRLSVGLALAALAAMPVACATTKAMRAGDGVPAGEGTVKVTEGDNGNTMMTIRVKHLAPASRMAPDATVYVVWVRPRNAATQSVGVLTLNDNLEGELDTVTPHSQFLVMVTPEPSGHVPQPTHEAVFTSDVELNK